jgi:hypothetical protein
MEETKASRPKCTTGGEEFSVRVNPSPRGFSMLIMINLSDNSRDVVNAVTSDSPESLESRRSDSRESFSDNVFSRPHSRGPSSSQFQIYDLLWRILMSFRPLFFSGRKVRVQRRNESRSARSPPSHNLRAKNVSPRLDCSTHTTIILADFNIFN